MASPNLFIAPPDPHEPYLELLSSVDAILWEADARTNLFSFVSPQAERLLGYPSAAWLQPGFWEAHIHPEDRDWVVEFCLKSTQEGPRHDFEYRMVAADGRVVWLRDIVTVIREGDVPARLRGVMIDITDRKRVDEERQAHVGFLENLDRVNRAIQGAPDFEHLLRDVLEVTRSIFACDRAWLLYPCDPAAPTWSVVMESTSAAYPGAWAANRVVPVDAEVRRVYATVTQATGPVAFGTGAAHALPAGVATEFGVQSQLVMCLRPRLDRPYLFGLHQCSAPRRWSVREERLFEEIGRRLIDALNAFLMQRRLRESEAHLAESQRMARVGWWERDFEQGVGRLSEESHHIFGLPVESQRDLADWEARWRQAIHPDDRDRVAAVAEAARAGRQPYDVEYRICRPDGETRVVHSQGRVIRDEQGAPIRMFGTMQDITELRRVEDELRASETRFRVLADLATDAFCLHDTDGTVLDVNDCACTHLGYRRDELIGLGPRDFDARLSHRDLRRCLQRLEAGEVLVFDTFHRRKDGSEFPVEVRIQPLWKDGRRFAVSLARDLTSRQRMEEQLRRASKLEAIGRLAGGVAHDFNNLLMVINGFGDVAQQSLEPGHPASELVAQIRGAGERAADLTRRLLAFSRQQVLQPEVVSINGILEGLQRLLRRLIGEDIELVFTPDRRLGLACVDPGQFEQAIINLAANARDAMPEGGRLTIETANVEVAEGAPIQPVLGSGRFVLVSIIDTGHGMDATTRASAFEPFFTTKGPGRGTGLGLAMVYGFVKQSGGHVEIDSDRESATAAGTGTIVRLYLPRVDGDTPAIRLHKEPDAAPRGTETVLIAEDEGAVRALCRMTLQAAGYTVIEARDGQEALALASRYEGAIHALLTDVVMPNMNGRRLAEVLAGQRPGLRVLMMSGYAGDIVPPSFAPSPGQPVLSKPFDPITLTRRLREVLDAEG